MPGRPSSSDERGDGLARESEAGRRRASGEDIPPCVCECVEGGETPSREEPDPLSHTASDRRAEVLAGAEQPARPDRLELEAAPKRLIRRIERRDGKPPTVLGGEVDAVESEVTRHVLEKVHELEPRADVVGPGDELGIRAVPDHAQHEASYGICGTGAVAAQVVPRL